MSNYDLEEISLIKRQMILSTILIFILIISLTLSYNEILKKKKEKPIYENEKDILTINRIFSLLVALGFLLINMKDENIKKKYNRQTTNSKLQISASLLDIIGAIIALYISFNSQNEAALENPEL